VKAARKRLGLTQRELAERLELEEVSALHPSDHFRP
jgi:transcriptional regulator with XRE-family HTH domain